MTHITEQGKKKIEEITEWFHRGDDDFEEYAIEMIRKGFSEDEALELLEKIFRTVANEYGD